MDDYGGMVKDMRVLVAEIVIGVGEMRQNKPYYFSSGIATGGYATTSIK